MNECVLVNASAPEMPPGRVRIIRYLRYLSSGTLKNNIVFEGPGAQVPLIPYDSDPPGGISGAEALTSTHSFVANETTRMLHILHILPFPEPRFVNPGFSGNPDIRMSGNADIRISDIRISGYPISGYPDVRISGYPEIRLSGYPDIRKSG